MVFGRYRGVWAAGLMVLLVAAQGFGEEEPRMALVIGNAAYRDAPLANPTNDANDMAEALSSIDWKVTKLINGDRKAMNRSVSSFRESLEASPHAAALLYYAGHGIQINGQNYLIPVNTEIETADDVVNDSVALQSILDALDAAQVSTQIIILDACRDNPFVKKSTHSLGGSRGLTVVNKAPSVEGSAVLFSTAPGDTAADGSGRNGIFTQVLLRYVKSDLPLQLVATKVTGEVKLLSGGKQTPFSSLSLSDEFYLVPASLRPAVAAKPGPQTLPFEPSNAPLAKKAPEGSGGLVTAGWLGLGGSAVFGTAAAVSFVLGSAAYKQYQSSSDPSEVAGYRETVSAMSSLFVTSAVLSLVSAATGGTCFFLDGKAR